MSDLYPFQVFYQESYYFMLTQYEVICRSRTNWGETFETRL